MRTRDSKYKGEPVILVFLCQMKGLLCEKKR